MGPRPRGIGASTPGCLGSLGAREVWVKQSTPGPVICTFIFRCCPPSTRPLSLPPLGRRHQLTPMMVPLSTQACTDSGERQAQGVSDQNTPGGDLQPSCSAGLGLPPPPASPSPHPTPGTVGPPAHVATLAPGPPRMGSCLLPTLQPPGALEGRVLV